MITKLINGLIFHSIIYTNLSVPYKSKQKRHFILMDASRPLPSAYHCRIFSIPIFYRKSLHIYLKLRKNKYSERFHVYPQDTGTPANNIIHLPARNGFTIFSLYAHYYLLFSTPHTTYSMQQKNIEVRNFYFEKITKNNKSLLVIKKKNTHK